MKLPSEYPKAVTARGESHLDRSAINYAQLQSRRRPELVVGGGVVVVELDRTLRSCEVVDDAPNLLQRAYSLEKQHPI